MDIKRTIVCGVNPDNFVLISAVAAVTKNIYNYGLYVVVLARRVGWVLESGIRLGKYFICREIMKNTF